MFSFLAPAAEGPGGIGLAFTDREGGVSQGSLGPLNLGRTDADDVEHVARNGERVRRALGVRHLVAAEQVHGTDVLVVDEHFLTDWGPRHWLGADGGAPPLPVADALVTREPDAALVVRVADCVPVLLACPTAGVLGAAHAGRAGFDHGVLPAVVGSMRALGARDVQAWIGPHVCGGCYEVPRAMAEQVGSRHPSVLASTRWGTPGLDLGSGCQHQLEELGVRVHRHDPCTLEEAALHSHRRDGAGAGRQAGIVWRAAAGSARRVPGS